MTEGCDPCCTRCSFFSITKNTDGSFSNKFSTADWMVNLSNYTVDHVNFLKYSDGTKKAIYVSADVTLAKSPAKTAAIFSKLKKALE